MNTKLEEFKYEEAKERYIQALELAPVQQLKAYILNQFALLDIVNNDSTSAKQKLSKALRIHNKLKNMLGISYNLQLQGQLLYNQKNYKKAQKETLTAAKLYEKLHNYSALIECLYLASQSLLQQQKYNLAEKYLRRILQIQKAHKNNFHIANAYSLLGLIYMKTGNLQRAKVLFQQSLYQEQRHSRYEGLVSDYANLACIEEQIGNKDIALSNLKISLEYAKKTENADLITLITHKIDKIT